MHRHLSAHGRRPDFYGLDGLLRLAPRLGTLEQGRRWVDYNGPVSPQLVDAVVASDADVVAFYPYLYHPTVGTIGKVKVPAVLHPAAHDEPALYLPVFRGTFGDADAFCFHTASERDLVERMYPVAERPQIVLGLGVGESEGTGRPGGELLGLGDRPYVVSVGRVDEHKGSKMLASYFATYKERHPGPLALALVGPVSYELPPHPDIVVTGAVDEPDKWDIVRDALVAVSPSALESFSLVVVEAWVDRCRSWSTVPAGRPGSTPSAPAAACGSRPTPSSKRCSTAWCPTPRCGPRSGANGRHYVDRHFQWPVLIKRYDEFLTTVVERGRGTPGLF